MNFEQMPTPENTFDKESVKTLILKVIDEHEDSLIDSFGEVPAETVAFYEKVKDLLASALRESSVVDRESFIRPLKYREEQGEDAEVIEYIIKNTRE